MEQEAQRGLDEDEWLRPQAERRPRRQAEAAGRMEGERLGDRRELGTERLERTKRSRK